jgi:GAF domain-containing protein
MKNLDLNNLSDIREIGKDQFDILYHISQMLNKVVYKDTLIAEALDLIIHVIKAERGLFARYNEAENQFSIVAARNINREKIADLSEFSSGILQKVISEKKPCLYHDVQSDPKLSQFESVMIHQIKSVIGMPIFYRGKVWGVILVDSLENRTEFSEENLIFLDFFSNLVSLALDKIIRFEVLEDENVILRNQLEATHHIPDMHQCYRAYPRGKRHRQRTGRPRHPSTQRPPEQSLPGAVLWFHSRYPAGKRVVRL